MGNVESFVAMSPINGEGLLISSADKRLVSAEAPQATGGERCIPDGAKGLFVVFAGCQLRLRWGGFRPD